MDAPRGRDLLGSVMPSAPDVFAELNTAFAPEPVVLAVPAGKTVPDPVVVTHEVSGAGRPDSPPGGRRRR